MLKYGRRPTQATSDLTRHHKTLSLAPPAQLQVQSSESRSGWRYGEIFESAVKGCRVRSVRYDEPESALAWKYTVAGRCRSRFGHKWHRVPLGARNFQDSPLVCGKLDSFYSDCPGATAQCRTKLARYWLWPGRMPFGAPLEKPGP